MRTKKENYSLLLKAVILLNWNQHEPFVLNGWELQKYFFLSQVLVNLSHRQFQTLSFIRKKKIKKDVIKLLIFQKYESA